MSRERQLHPNQRPVQVPPAIYAEVIVFFRQNMASVNPKLDPNVDPDEDKHEGPTTVAFRRASYVMQTYPSGAALVIQEQVGDREAHVFHWEDVERLKLVPSKIGLVEGS